MLLKLILLAVALDKPVFHELKVGDVIPLSYDKPIVRPSPQSPTFGGGAGGGNGVSPFIPVPAPHAYTAPDPVVIHYTGDPYNFGAFLNSQRAARGLHALAHDPGLSALAARSCSMGYGHHGLNPGRENAGMGPASVIWPAWTTSPGHAAALFDPYVRSYGIACVGSVWIYNAR